jgi:hypothetical protein
MSNIVGGRRTAALAAAAFGLVMLGAAQDAHAVTTTWWHVRATTCSQGSFNRNMDGSYTIGAMQNQSSVSETRVFCDVQLPENATITAFYVYGSDSSASNMTIYLQRYPYNGTTLTTIATVTSSNAATTWSSTGLSHAINNPSYVYQVAAIVPNEATGAALQLWTFEIEYTTP